MTSAAGAATTDPDELLEVYDPEGRPTGAAKKRAAIHHDGDWHLAFFCWIVHDRTEVVLQRRAATKDVWPGRFDASAAGHVRFGETTSDAARELEEELGLRVDVRELEPLTRHRQEHVHDNGIVDREIHDVHLLRSDLPLVDYRPGPEVSGLVAVPLDAIVALVEGERESIDATLVTFDPPAQELLALRKSDLVPYDASYWRCLVAAARSRRAAPSV
jgi:isopentenyl-diphosphate delta-isomerase type 1